LLAEAAPTEEMISQLYSEYLDLPLLFDVQFPATMDPRHTMAASMRNEVLDIVNRIALREPTDMRTLFTTPTIAVNADLGKHPSETELTELQPVLSEINHTSAHLRGWMRPRRVATPLTLVGTRSEVRAEPKGVVLILAPPPDSTPLVRADALRLQQIVWNLLANSIKFTPRHGRVVVRVEREPERYLVSVEDDGIGIPESDLPHIFERFRQVDGSPTRRHPGMGIGLALVRSLVELHGGTIWAESVVGHGSRFTFSLPISASERRTASVTAAARVADESEVGPESIPDPREESADVEVEE
jgi:signal transduction histidine kinase